MSAATLILTPHQWFLQLNTLMEIINQSIQQKNFRKLRVFNLQPLIRTTQCELLAPDIVENPATILSIFYRAQIIKQLLALQGLIKHLPRFFIPYCSSLYLRQKRNVLDSLETIAAHLKEAIQRLLQLKDLNKDQDTSSIPASTNQKFLTHYR